MLVNVVYKRTITYKIRNVPRLKNMLLKSSRNPISTMTDVFAGNKTMQSLWKVNVQGRLRTVHICFQILLTDSTYNSSQYVFYCNCLKVAEGAAGLRTTRVENHLTARGLKQGQRPVQVPGVPVCKRPKEEAFFGEESLPLLH